MQEEKTLLKKRKSPFGYKNSDLCQIVWDAHCAERPHLDDLLTYDVEDEEAEKDLPDKVEQMWEIVDRLIARYGYNDALYVILGGCGETYLGGEAESYEEPENDEETGSGMSLT